MKDKVTTTITRYQQTFTGFTAGQKVVSILGTGALLLAAFLVFQWVSTPSFAPLFSNLSSKDASAIVQQLDAQGVEYKLAGGGDTIMVPKDQVYATRIQLSGEGLPASSDSGYSLLDTQSLSTSEFQEQTTFKRAMEGELSQTIEALDDVDTAVVHLALPTKQVFADTQDPATASVLVDTPAGSTLSTEEVQAVVHLVASSIDGMNPDDVTVADAEGHVLTLDDTEAGMAGTRSQAIGEFQSEMQGRIQATLDKVIGPGNSTVTVTADLDFDKSVTRSTTYSKDPKSLSLSESESTEDYTGPAGSSVGGVLGPDGQMDPTTTPGADGSKYSKKTKTSDNAIDTTIEEREAAPGSVNSLHIGIVLDSSATQVPPEQIRSLISSAVGIDRKRGDTVQVSAVAFNRTAQETAKKELDAAAAADKKAETLTLYRNIGIGVVAVLVLLVMWLRGRKKAKARQAATTLVVEQLREEAASRHAITEGSPALLALEQDTAADEMREELAALVERQPEDVANLLRGWLVDRA
jgi:flagellar M-ring protein FliF